MTSIIYTMTILPPYLLMNETIRMVTFSHANDRSSSCDDATLHAVYCTVPLRAVAWVLGRLQARVRVHVGRW